MDHKKVTPYGGEHSKKQQVENMFDNIAPKYDLLNRVLSAGVDVKWRRRMVRATVSSQPSKILDIATGTGDVAIMLAQKSPASLVEGLDLSAKMLEIARRKASRRNLSHISFVQGDSENLPYPSNTFDAITVAFGVRNFEDTRQGLAECKRVLKAGGSLHVLEFSQPQLTPFKQLYRFYFRHVLPVIGKLTSKDPKAYHYLFESVQSFPAGKEFASLLEGIGYYQVSRKPLTLGICTLYSGKKR
ncbi:MAG: bifunctional demethylmenaquinone methyltransferase/2-methoxy-6-polyprenyl-1,4-benzoquinol methylase UbiE [Saprospiraceae bacterium]|nr:bifunctional demethylmenaquinone methyltransferase/2-methoxy-6-polyprenyl-1,4-benzoquinol methylase UbiE [Saprospiraceae bacterium]